MSAETKHVVVRYDAPVAPTVDGDRLEVMLSTDAMRAGPSVSGELVRPEVARDALLGVGDVLASDLRFKAQDRSDYLAYLATKGKAASNELWNAQKAYLDAKYGEQEEVAAPLDPILHVTDDGVALEVFSRDESSYARLFLSRAAFSAPSFQSGTTNLNLTSAALQAIARIRSYRTTSLTVRPGAGGEDREIAVPYRWIRAFGQVQAASTLPASTFELAPVDLYNVLLTLKRQRARTSPRALRYELVPGEAPRLVLEPWDLVFTGTAGPYEGDRPIILRTWGRKRLMALARVLPHAKKVQVHVLGAGLPAIYVVDLGDAQLTLSLSGWVDSGWAGIATFDLLAAGTTDDLLAPRVLQRLGHGPASIAALASELGRSTNEIRQALLVEIERGCVVHDVPGGVFRARALFSDAVEREHVRYRDAGEAEAHRLLQTPGQVEITKLHDLGVEGMRIEGTVADERAHRVYSTSFTLDREGRTVDATCTSPQFRRAGLREGPTVPMIALRLAYARKRVQLEAARNTEEGRRLIRAETRTLIRRERGGSTTYRISLDDRQVVLRWGRALDAMRMHRLFFGSAEEAKEEYFARLDGLAERGYIDSTSAESG